MYLNMIFKKTCWVWPKVLVHWFQTWIPTFRWAIPIVCVTMWEGGRVVEQHN